MSFGYFQIQYGDYQELDVLIELERREVWITLATAARLLGWSKSYRVPEKLKSKSLESVAGGKLTPPKKCTAKDILGRKNQAKAIPFSTFTIVLMWQIRQGNDRAMELAMAGFADSFTSLALEQAGYQVSMQERQEVLQDYLQGYHKFFDWIRDKYLENYGTKPARSYYANINRRIDEVLCGVSSYKGSRKKNCETSNLREIENFQRSFMRWYAPKLEGKDVLPHIEIEKYLVILTQPDC